MVTQTDPVERYAFFDHGLEMTRRFRGLKIWTVLKARGVAGIRDAVARNIELRLAMDARIRKEPLLEGLGSGLSITCFRYRPATPRPASEVNDMNRRILESIVREGRAYLSPTVLGDHYALRACLVNYRTRREDVDFLLDEVLRFGRELELGSFDDRLEL